MIMIFSNEHIDALHIYYTKGCNATQIILFINLTKVTKAEWIYFDV